MRERVHRPKHFMVDPGQFGDPDLFDDAEIAWQLIEGRTADELHASALQNLYSAAFRLLLVDYEDTHNAVLEDRKYRGERVPPHEFTRGGVSLWSAERLVNFTKLPRPIPMLQDVLNGDAAMTFDDLGWIIRALPDHLKVDWRLQRRHLRVTGAVVTAARNKGHFDKEGRYRPR